MLTMGRVREAAATAAIGAAAIGAAYPQLKLMDERLTCFWLLMLTAFSINVLVLRRLWEGAQDRTNLLLALTYVVGCGYRSLFPLLWETRPYGCLFATPGMLLGGDLSQLAAVTYMQ